MEYSVEDSNEHRKAVIIMAIAAVLWSLGGLLIKSISWSPPAIAGARSGIAAVIFWAYLRRPQFKWSTIQIAGALAYSATVILFVMANKMTTAANAILLQYTAPIYVALFGSWFLGERTTKVDWLTTISVLGGMVLFFQEDLSVGGFWGNVFAIFSGVSFAAMVLILRKQKTESPMESVLLGNVFTAVICLPFYFQSPPPAADWVLLLLLGVFQLGISYILYSLAIKGVTAMEGVLIPVIEPLLNPIWVGLLLREVPGPWAILGGMVVLIAVTSRCLVGVFWEKKKAVRTRTHTRTGGQGKNTDPI